MRVRPLPLRSALTVAIVALLANGCDSGGDRSTAEESASARTSAEGRLVEISAVGDRFEYDRTRLEASAGETLTVALTNPSKQKTIKHNFVLLESDNAATATEVAKAGWRATDDEYVPDHGAVVAGSPLAGPGETVDVTFEAPEDPGEYLYICTYPGHYPPMDGILVVRE